MLELASTLSHRPRTPADRPIGGCGSGWSKQRQLVVGRRMVGSWLNISQTLVITHDVSVIFGENPKPGFEPRNLDFLGCNINPTFFMVASADGMDQYLWKTIFGVDRRPFASYFGVHLGYRHHKTFQTDARWCRRFTHQWVVRTISCLGRYIRCKYMQENIYDTYIYSCRVS